MKINSQRINDYKRLMQTTDLQQDYQEFIKFFRGLRTSLSGNMADFRFTGNIVENAMDYSYFQFTDDELQAKGLKIVIVFVHKDCDYEIWLSGLNRKIQIKFHTLLSSSGCKYELSRDPNRVDYIFKDSLIAEMNYDDCEKLLKEIEMNIIEFIQAAKKIVAAL